MISYCAQGCILEWQTMLHKGVFIFFGRKINFPFFECPKWVFLWRTYHIFVAKLDQINFLKYYAIFNAQLTKWLGVKSFDPPLVKKTNSHRFSWKRVKFELQLPHSLLFIFSNIISSYISTYLIINTWFGGDTSRFGRWPRAPTLERVNSHARRVVTAWPWRCLVFWVA